MTLSAKQLAQSTRRRERLVEICGARPEVTYEVVGKEHIAFRVRKKIFAYYLLDHYGDGIIAFCCKSSLSEQRRLVRDDPESFFVPLISEPKDGSPFDSISTTLIGTPRTNSHARLFSQSCRESWRH